MEATTDDSDAGSDSAVAVDAAGTGRAARNKRRKQRQKEKVKRLRSMHAYNPRPVSGEAQPGSEGTLNATVGNDSGSRSGGDGGDPAAAQADALSRRREFAPPVMRGPDWGLPEDLPHRDIVISLRAAEHKSKWRELLDFYGAVLQLVDAELAAMDREDAPAAGRSGPMHLMEHGALKRSQQWGGRLLAEIEAKQLPKSVKQALLRIKRCLLRRQYVQATSAYYDLTVGRALWPTAPSVPSVLDDDDKRNMLHAVKSMMSFWEKRVLPDATTA